MIRALDASVKHQIVAGQVITDFESASAVKTDSKGSSDNVAVKELIENALDSQATSIEIRLKDSGLESFDVQDNGTGIAQADYPNIALRGHTSKLASFESLDTVSTFGFRGEALASLCSLGRMTVSTATAEDAPMGHALTFDNQGKLLTSTREARTRGTTVSVSKLFERVPVRRKEFERNIKKQFKRVNELVQSYALISQGVRISLSNWDKGKKMPLLLSDGASMAKTFSALFGAKAFSSLTPLNLDFVVEPDKPVLRATEGQATTTPVQISGYISKPQKGEGRTTSDRQFFYINGRPFNPSKIPRAVNEVYKSFNANQSPCVIADFHVATDAYDVNLSPDKRTILMHNESNLIEALKTSLEEALAPFRSMYSTQATAPKQIGLTQPIKVPQIQPPTPPASQTRRSISPASDEIDQETPPIVADIVELESSPPATNGAHSTPTQVPRQKSVAISLEPRQLTLDTTGTSWSLRDHGDTAQPRKKRKVSFESAPNKRAAFSTVVKSFAANGDGQRHLELRLAEPDEGDEGQESPDPQSEDMQDDENQLVDDEMASRGPEEEGRTLFRRSSSEQQDVAMLGQPPDQAAEEDESAEQTQERFEVPHMPASSPAASSEEPPLRRSESQEEMLDEHLRDLAREGSEVVFDDTVFDAIASRSLAFDFDKLKQAWTKPLIANGNHMQEDEETVLEAELAGLSVDDAEAEAALSRIVSQEDFAGMTVVGQFNLGFIVARGKRDSHDDLWILDQHASDEKRNFEQRAPAILSLDVRSTFYSPADDEATVPAPRTLNLPSADELLVLENLEVLKANGFEVAVDESAPSGSRIQLVAHPTSKSTVFGVSDLEEIIHLLHDAPPGQLVRPAKVRAMFAMRACRMSVMVGHALTVPQMTGIIRRMATMESPWACPHGRPTMRWLANSKSSETFAAQETTDWDVLDQ